MLMIKSYFCNHASSVDIRITIYIFILYFHIVWTKNDDENHLSKIWGVKTWGQIGIGWHLIESKAMWKEFEMVLGQQACSLLTHTQPKTHNSRYDFLSCCFFSQALCEFFSFSQQIKVFNFSDSVSVPVCNDDDGFELFCSGLVASLLFLFWPLKTSTSVTCIVYVCSTNSTSESELQLIFLQIFCKQTQLLKTKTRSVSLYFWLFLALSSISCSSSSSINGIIFIVAFSLSRTSIFKRRIQIVFKICTLI